MNLSDSPVSRPENRTAKGISKLTVSRRSPGETLVIFFSTGAWLGRMPFMPGTFGTLAGIPLFLALYRLPVWVYIPVVFILYLIAVRLADAADRLMDRHDHPSIVIDEVIGYLVTMIGAPASPAALLAGFFFFRVVDITKPWPCRTIDRQVGGGVGVVLDDVAAGVYALGLLQLTMFLWPVF